MNRPRMNADEGDFERRLRRIRPAGEYAAIEQMVRHLEVRAQSDATLCHRLKEDVHEVLKGRGLLMPPDLTIHVLQDDASTTSLILPLSESIEPEGLPPEAVAVIAKARADMVFRAELLTSPRDALWQHFNFRLPSSIELRIRQNTCDQLYMVLPGARESDELSDLELELVAGGRANPFRRRRR